MKQVAWLLLLLCCGATVPDKANVHSLVRVELDDQESAVVMANDRSTGLITPVETAMTPDGLVFTGPPNTYLVIVTRIEMVDGKPRVHTDAKTCVIGTPTPVPPGPTPNPVVPRPDGFAGMVYDEARKVNDAAGCAALSAVCDSLVSKIAAGAYANKNAQNVIDDWAELNKGKVSAAWKPFGVWLVATLRTQVYSVDDAHGAMVEIAKGLNAAGGKQ